MDKSRTNSKKAISTKFFLRSLVLFVVLLLVILVAPYVINELYEMQSGYLNMVVLRRSIRH